MLVYSRGHTALLGQRFTRIFLLLVITTVTIVPLDKVIEGYALRTSRREPALTNTRSGHEAAVRGLLATPRSGRAARGLLASHPAGSCSCRS